MVVGGGPAGLEAARIASLRGHRVVLYEMEEKLGGQLNIASVPPTKQELTKAIRYLSVQAEKSGVQLEMGKEVTADMIDRIKPDAVIVATGAGPLIPDIPGINNPKVITVKDVLSCEVAVGQRILIVGGGMAGAETADYLTSMATDITLLEMTEEIASDMVLWQKEFLMERLSASGVKIMTSAVVSEFLDDGVVFTKDGKEVRITGFDNMILAMGNSTVNGLYEDLKEHVTELYIIGDASSPRNALDAIREGAECGLKL
jgi:pyruvate/2-oxoglutarate dehydrogenase complex dihydrolipoamide dehydrogenase (E3) component